MATEGNSSRKAEIFRLRREGETFASIAHQLGISRQRVSQLLTPPKGILRLVAERQDGACLDCGLHCNGKGQVHHISVGHEDIEDYNDIENLVLLCPSCHRKRHQVKKEPFTRPEAVPAGFLFCAQCTYIWEARVELPKECPDCKSRRWNK